MKQAMAWQSLAQNGRILRVQAQSLEGIVVRGWEDCLAMAAAAVRTNKILNRTHMHCSLVAAPTLMYF